MSVYRIISLVILALFIASCGYKSDLYLPKEKPAKSVAGQKTDEKQQETNDANGQQEQN
jgi:predicted small lipoprotein YifL